MIAALPFAARVRTVINHARLVMVGCVAVGIPVFFAWAVYGHSKLFWVYGQGRFERYGAQFSYLLREGGVIEKVAYAAGEPSATIEDLGTFTERQWRIVSKGRVILTSRDGSLAENVPSYYGSTGEWFAGEREPNKFWASAYVYRAKEGLVISARGMPCEKVLQWISPYARTRMRAAWGVDRVGQYPPAPADQWAPVGDARKVCAEGPGKKSPDGDDPLFLMLFEMPQDASAPRTAAGG